eukprot:PhM_4_TR560/c0_g1_i1/m.97171
MKSILSVVILCLAAALTAVDASSLGTVRQVSDRKNAVVTIFYETGTYDYEYALGSLVLMGSVARHGCTADRVMLLSSDTSKHFRDMFASYRDAGGKLILRDIPDVRNPYEGKSQQRFLRVLNKLYAWRMVEYDRVIMADADTILLRNPEKSLFRCGSFCAVYFNPLRFHTGLMVLKPEEATYRAMTEDELLKNRMGSFDFADMGFLNSFYSKTMIMGPILDLNESLQETEEVNVPQRLTIQANMHHFYFYDRMSWEGAMGGFDNLVSMTFPAPQTLKPWCWYGFPILAMHWLWHDYRMHIDSYANYPGSWFCLIVVMPVLFFVTKIVAERLTGGLPLRVPVHVSPCGVEGCSCISRGTLFIYNFSGVVLAMSSVYVASHLIPCYVPYALAWLLLYTFNLWFHFTVLEVVALWRTGRGVRLSNATGDLTYCLSVFTAPYIIMHIIFAFKLYSFHVLVPVTELVICIGIWFVCEASIAQRMWLSHLAYLRGLSNK